MSKPVRIGRRNFLRGAGGAALLIPPLVSLMPRSAWAGTLNEPTRKFITYRITNGFFGHHWFPSPEAAAGLTPLQGVSNVKTMPLADIEGDISPLLDSRFDAYRDSMNLLRHIDRLDTADHTQTTGLFGWGNLDGVDTTNLPPSIDQLIGAHGFDVPNVPISLGIRWSESGATCSYTKSAEGAVIAEPSLYPDQAFAQHFANLDLDPETAARWRSQKEKLVDRALDHYKSVRDNPRLSSSDRDKLNQHMDHMSSLENYFAGPAAECSMPDQPINWSGGKSPDNVNAAAQATIDLAIAALRCELSNVINLYLDPDTMMSDGIHGVIGGHHGASHDPGREPSIYNAHRWHMDYFHSLIEQLDLTLDPITQERMLDSSLVLLHNEIGNQNGSEGGDNPDQLDLNHEALDNQVLLVGSCGGRLATGNYLDYATEFERNRWSKFIGTSYNWVMVSCMLAMGLSPDDWEVDGEPGYGDMRGAKYNMTPLDQVVVGDLRTYLPGLEA